MVTVIFNSNGGALIANAVFLGDIVANYEMLLRERDSNAQTSLLSGDNLNPENDNVPLPTPPNINDGRRVLLQTGFCGNHPNINPDYEIRLEIFQDGQIIGFNSDTGILNGKGQFSLLFIKLVAQ
ncbi:MAG: hypothetical protein WKG06_11195 [Segetibacter sp.]